MATQTLESQWGREPLTVSFEIPTVMLRFRLAREHVSTPDDAIVTLVSEAVDRQGTYTAEQRAETLAAALWIHHEQQAAHRAVATGRL